MIPFSNDPLTNQNFYGVNTEEGGISAVKNP